MTPDMSLRMPILSGRMDCARANVAVSASAAPPSRICLLSIRFPPFLGRVLGCLTRQLTFLPSRERCEPAQRVDECFALAAPENLVDRGLLFGLNDARPREQRAARRRERDRVRPAIGARPAAFGEAASLELVHHCDEIRPLNA